ncbi:unnamed protein product, partial [Candidula unifasciata]
ASNMILADDSHILAELDMYLDKQQFLSLYQPPNPDEDYKGSGIRTKRKAARNTRWRWTNAELPYLFAKGHFDKKEEYLIRRAMTEWERYTCMRFRPAVKTDRNSVRFQNGVGCNSQLGMVGGVQSLNLQAPGCRYKGLYLHEIGHALGLVHEHQLPDRDDYIRILYENVDPVMRIWFNKYTSKEVNQMNVKYEYSSVMHYGITAFSHDGKSQTISAHDKSKEASIGRVYLKELAYTDVHIVNLMYNCSSHCSNQNECGSGGHLDQNCKCICPDGSSDCARNNRNNNEACVNNYDSWACYIWANQGECERNPLYMKQECAKACGVCGTDLSNKGMCREFPDVCARFVCVWGWGWGRVVGWLAFTSHALQDIQCYYINKKDKVLLCVCSDVFQDRKCQMWKERGDCVTNQRWMQINCRATCGLCGDVATRPQVNCKNAPEHEAKCDEWAKDGECSVNADWMFTNCRKSCALCDVDGIGFSGNTTGVDEDNMACENNDPMCEEWAAGGECGKNPSWMITNCRQACNKCDDGKCKNLYDDVQCEIWAQKLECLTNTEWMGKHCSKACGRGICVGTDPSSRPTTAKPGKYSTSSSPVTSGEYLSPCLNRHKSDTECDIWARHGHCNINPGWMKANCALACKVCSGTGTTKGTGVITGGCQDTDSSCASRVAKGGCNNEPSFTLTRCKKSCNNCNGCRDTNALCGIWAENDHCNINPRYMLKQCQRSCNTCFV